MSAGPTYEMRLSLNVLNHLGISLYSNLPAVLSEAVANSWDADASFVTIDIDPKTGRVVIEDDGLGMTPEELNDRYLKVGYERRTDKSNPYGRKTPSGRPVMGRKGIGKLSLLSVARTVEVTTVARRPVGADDAVLTRAGVRLDYDEIQKQIKANEGLYQPKGIPSGSIDDDRPPGTKIVLTGPRKDLRQTATHLRRRLARRFSMTNEGFEIVVNGSPITPADRDLVKRCRYIWIFGPTEYTDQIKAAVPSAERVEIIEAVTDGGEQVRGWVGASKTSTDLKPLDPHDESLNRVAVVVRGKLAQEDVLESAAQGGIFTKYLSGEIHADFLDEDDQDDIATSSRQGIVEDDPRFQDFRVFLTKTLRQVGNDWSRFREDDGVKDATEKIPAVEKWLATMTGDTAAAARRYIGRLQSASAGEKHSRQLISSGVVAFERLQRSDRLSKIDETDDANLAALVAAFQSVDDVESALYYDIVAQRLKIIDKFVGLTDDDAIESVLRDYLFEHLWLLDPGWDKATVPVMETAVHKIIEKVKDANRVDIKYRRTGGSDVIVELKRAGRVVSTQELLAQTEKYRVPINDYLTNASSGTSVDVEVVCVVGKDLSDWKNRDGRERSRNALANYNTKVITFNELIKNARQAYGEYLQAHAELGELRAIVSEIEAEADSEAEAEA